MTNTATQASDYARYDVGAFEVHRNIDYNGKRAFAVTGDGALAVFTDESQAVSFAGAFMLGDAAQAWKALALAGVREDDGKLIIPSGFDGIAA